MAKRINKNAINDKDIRAIYNYEDEIVKKALWLLKYKGIRDISDIFADIIISDLDNRSNSPLVLIPIPITHGSFKKRGFNQSLLICRSIQRKAPERFSLVFDVLKKKRGAKMQTQMRSRSERLVNIRNTFYIDNNSLVEGKNIILIDDVVTTGATLKESRRTLLDAGALNVSCIAIAYRSIKNTNPPSSST